MASAARITRDEALLTLTGSGPILDVAREVSQIMREHGIDGAVIGGVAVVLHGHVRTTLDVDVYVPATEPMADALAEHGYTVNRKSKEFLKSGVPVHLITSAHLQSPPRRTVQIDGVQTVALADLVNIKLRSGLGSMLRAQDIADVIGLIRCHALRSDFAAQLEKDLRTEFRKLARAVHNER
jgi:hypothetical protein